MEDILANLHPEKQNVIINAAFSEFSKNGYRKTSVADISSAAGISKAMVFYYFGNKKTLYMKLIEFSWNIIIKKVEASVNSGVTDFFDKIRISSEIKMSMTLEYPTMLMFMKSVYFEKDAEVSEDIKRQFEGAEIFRETFMANDTDTGKFKDSVDAELILKFIYLAAEGFSAKLSAESGNEELIKFADDFYRFLNILKNNFYKQEYLT